jgi:hypothetical protein
MLATPVAMVIDLNVDFIETLLGDFDAPVCCREFHSALRAGNARRLFA